MKNMFLPGVSVTVRAVRREGGGGGGWAGDLNLVLKFPHIRVEL